MFEINQKKSRRIHGRVRFPDGSWRQQTSGCEDPKDADRVFEAMQYFMNQSSLPHNDSPQALLRLMRRVYEEKYHEKCPLMLTEDFFGQVIATNRHYVADSTQAQTARTAKLYLKFLAHESKVGSLLEYNTSPLVKRFGAYLVEHCKHNVNGANSRLEKLETIFGEGLAERLMADNPAHDVRLKDRNAESEEELEIHQPWTKEHIYRGIDRGIAPGCNPEMTIFTLVSSDLGVRGGDGFALDRSMFNRHEDPKKNFFLYYARKPKKWHKVYPCRSTVPLIWEYLDHHLPDRSEKAPFYPTYGYPTGPKVPDKDFNHGSAGALGYYGVFLDTLGNRVKLPSELEGRAHYSHATHSNRVLCITMAAQDNVPESITRKRVLHNGAEVHRIYQKHSPEAVQRAMNAGEYNEEGVVNITMAEFKAAVEYATERLRSLRGKLDLHDGKPCNMTHRASLRPVVAGTPAVPGPSAVAMDEAA